MKGIQFLFTILNTLIYSDFGGQLFNYPIDFHLMDLSSHKLIFKYSTHNFLSSRPNNLPAFTHLTDMILQHLKIAPIPVMHAPKR